MKEQSGKAQVKLSHPAGTTRGAGDGAVGAAPGWGTTGAWNRAELGLDILLVNYEVIICLFIFSSCES